MKKLFLLAVMMLLQVANVCAQSDFYIIPPMGGDKFGITGGKDGKSYMVTYKSDKKRQELYNATINMLESMGLVDKSKVKGKKVEEGMTEVVVPFWMATGIGIHGGTAPLHLSGDLRFEFYDGGMRLKVENFNEDFFIVHYKPEMGKEGTETYKQYQEFIKEANEANKATSGFGKFMAKVDKLKDLHISAKVGAGGASSNAKQVISSKINEANAERIKTLENYRERVGEQEALFKKMQAAGEGEWYDLPEYIKAVSKCDYFEKYPKAKAASLDHYNKALAANKLYALPDKRWARDIRYIFDGVFITLSEEIGADIMEVSEDGVLTWDREGDAVLPVDKKLRAKMAKKGKSFTDFDSYDN